MQPGDRTTVSVPTAPSIATAERVTAFLRTVYGWIFVGLGITAIVAFSIASTPALVQAMVRNHLLFLGLFVGQIGLVFYLSARVDRLSPDTATLLFLIYSALRGVTLSVVLLAYTGTSIATTFLVTAGMFGALAVYGSTTTRALAGAGHFLFMGLIGLILASLVGTFWHSAALQFLISVVGVIVFTGLTAWDAQRLKQLAAAAPEGRLASHAILGALSLYLDFINLFLFLLRFHGEPSRVTEAARRLYCDGWELRDQPLAIYGRSDHKGGGLALELTLWASMSLRTPCNEEEYPDKDAADERQTQDRDDDPVLSS